MRVRMRSRRLKRPGEVKDFRRKAAACDAFIFGDLGCISLVV